MITQICENCQQEIKLDITQAELEEWQKGSVLIQKAFPHLDPGERELLISGTCGKCFDQMFAADR